MKGGVAVAYEAEVLVPNHNVNVGRSTTQICENHWARPNKRYRDEKSVLRPRTPTKFAFPACLKTQRCFKPFNSI